MRRNEFLALMLLGASGCAACRMPDRSSDFEILSRGALARGGAARELSGITPVTGSCYFGVDDKDGSLHTFEIRLDGTGAPLACRQVGKPVRLAGRRDLEDCVFDSLTGWVWVADEADASVRAYDPATGAEVDSVSMPAVFFKARGNRSLESLALSSDGLTMWTANEDTLVCDGASASVDTNGVVRIQKFVRKDSRSRWRPSGQYAYQTDEVEGGGFRGMSISGVSALTVAEDGRLFVLEREMSRKRFGIPGFRTRLYAVDVSRADDVSRIESLEAWRGKFVEKTLAWSRDSLFSNYEGLCFGPRLADGSRTLVLVSDGGGGADENILILVLR